MVLELLTLPVVLFFQYVILRFFPLQLLLERIPVFSSLKRAVAFRLIQHHRGGQAIRKSKFDTYDIDAVSDRIKTSVVIPQEEYIAESPRDLKDALTTDEVFFYGTNNKGGCLVVRLARRIDDFAEVWIYLKMDDGRTYAYPKDLPIRMPENDGRTFRAGGLRLEYLTPMRKWRVAFNGALRKVNDEDSQNDIDLVHVRFGFVWTPITNLLDFEVGIHPSLLSSILAKEGWSEMNYFAERLAKGTNRYDQFGQLRGTVVIEDNDEEELYLWGSRSRSTEKLSHETSLTKNQSIQRFYGGTKNGVYFHIGTDNSLEGSRSVYGFVIPRDNRCHQIDSWNNKQFTTDGFNVTVTAGNKQYVIEIKERKKLIKFQHHLGREGTTQVQRAEFICNGDEGHGVVLLETSCPLPKDAEKAVLLPKISEKSSLVLPFEDPACKDVKSTGGKGSSLAQLMEASQRSKEFLVPKGVVVTSHAYRILVNTNDLNKEIRSLEEAAWRNPTSLNKVCERTVNQFRNASFPNGIRTSIEEQLKVTIGPNFESKKFAVRSSGIGEDSEDLSAAGQMDTFLGVQGMEEICSALTKCWASQFDVIAVNYKKNNGQALDSDMAVVIQEMVPSEVAGVMFTCNPSTGDPRYTLITANYGLGESVVSASADPDTIILERTLDNEFSVHKIETGRKKMKITMDDHGGTKEEEIAENESEACCLKKEQALLLGKIGAELEDIYGSPRDTEWAIVGDKIYFLQARPVTSINSESDFEIMHEMDTANLTETDYATRANVGEGHPGAVSYLQVGYTQKMHFIFERAQRKTVGITDKTYYPYAPRGFFIAINHFFFSLCEGMIKIVKKEDETAFSKAYVISFFGREIDDDELREICSQRQSEETKMQSIKRLFTLLKQLIFMDRNLNNAIKKYWSLEVPIKKCKTANEMFEVIDQHLHFASEGYETFFTCNTPTSLYNLILLTVLAKSNKGNMSSEGYSDFATMMSSCEKVESADVPTAMTKLAAVISKYPEHERFKTMNDDEALQWLKEFSPSEVKAAFKNFLSKHGHRGYKEFDFQCVTWGMDPRPLIATLRNMVGISNEEHNKVLSVQEAIKQIKTPLSFFNKLLIKIFLPLSRKAVGIREQGKSMIIKVCDVYRKAYLQLASQMVAEGYLPDKELIFFLTPFELKSVLETRSPRLIAKAKKRQRLFPKMDQMQFEEIIKGVVKPINDKAAHYSNLTTSSGLTMKGTPISNGIVKARARVAHNLKEAADLQKGEILITHCTDIGWSPYFPLISGIATELGGLISHGAVIAREYGLPCVVAVHGATAAFKTGDMVLLDGKRGILQRIDEDLNTTGS